MANGPGCWSPSRRRGGLVVGITTRLISGNKEGHGVVDVMESVARTRGFVRFRTALEKILTSAVTIGTGGSAGAEGPIVQIGAAVSSGVGSMFRLARHQMPVLVGCGCAAGISAIFNAPIGGLLFTLEVVLLDFSVRAITPIIVAAVIANVTMRAVIPLLHGEAAYITVFADPSVAFAGPTALNWPQVPAYIVLGLACGAVGAGLTRSMQLGEVAFRRLITGPSWIKAMRPAVGGFMLGLLGLTAIWFAHPQSGGGSGPFDFEDYPMPAFYGDGYGIIETLLSPDAGFFTSFGPTPLLMVLIGLALLKMLATVFTLSSGGSGGVIAPSLFLGAVTGGAIGVALRASGIYPNVEPAAYVLVGMAALLAAVVHAPLASILILLEITAEAGQTDAILLPALLAVVVALGLSRLLVRDSIYTAALRTRGVRRMSADPTLLSRMTVEQVSLDPASTLRIDEPFERVLDAMSRWDQRDFIVLDDDGRYAGYLAANDVNTAMLGREATKLMVVGEVMRSDVPLLGHTDDLQEAFDLFARLDVAHLPVTLGTDEPGEFDPNGKVIGTISRAGLMRRYRLALEG